MARTSRLGPLALAALLLALLPAGEARAQFGMGPAGDQLLTIRVKVLDEAEMRRGETPPLGRPSAIAGLPGSGRALDQVALSTSAATLSYEVSVDGIWQATARDGEPSGVEGRPFSGLRLRASRGSIRYRLSFVGSGHSPWAEDGAAILKEGARVDAVEAEHRPSAREGQTISYRARFRGEDWTPWVSGGTPLEAKDEKGELLAFEVRSSMSIRYEASLSGRGWQSTRADGGTSGDPSGNRFVEAFRIFGGDGPVRYRSRTAAGWGAWFQEGASCGRVGFREAVTGLEVQLIR